MSGTIATPLSANSFEQKAGHPASFYACACGMVKRLASLITEPRVASPVRFRESRQTGKPAFP
jgi:hypothetical protein